MELALAYGVAADVSGSLGQGCIRVHVAGRTDGIGVELLPLYPPFGPHYDLPAKGETVAVYLINNNIYHGFWERRRPQITAGLLTDGDKDSAKVLAMSDLAENGDEGVFFAGYRKSRGAELALADASLCLRQGGGIALSNNNRAIYIGDGISLGTDGGSAEPAVLGLQNEDALNRATDALEEAGGIIEKHARLIKTGASASPYTAALSPLFEAFAAELGASIKKHIAGLRGQIPKTKSNVVTLD